MDKNSASILRRNIPAQAKLRRSLTLPLLILYGLGVTIGAGEPAYIDAGFGRAGLATVVGVLVVVSRVIYGMADRGRLPTYFARVSPYTQTPHVATAFVPVCILSLSLFLPIERLAGWTSQIVLCVFICVIPALIAIKRRPEPASDHFAVPILVPVFGTITSTTLLGVSLL